MGKAFIPILNKAKEIAQEVRPGLDTNDIGFEKSIRKCYEIKIKGKHNVNIINLLRNWLKRERADWWEKPNNEKVKV